MPPVIDLARRHLTAHRGAAPATAANVARNARAGHARHARWAPARDALWVLLEPLVATGARVAVAGAGNADTLPLCRLARRAGEVVLVDVDGRAPSAARRRLPRELRRRVAVEVHDVTGGAADALARAAAGGPAPAVVLPTGELPGAPYDVVVGDLLYSQLLYPALVDLGLAPEAVRAAVMRHARHLTHALVQRLHASAPGGTVVHVHDPIAWWDGHPQPVRLDELLELAARDPQAAADRARTGQGPRESDPRDALAVLGLPVHATALWHWPFTDGVDYLACATVSSTPPGRS
jgi:hypothetical protein